MTLKRMACIVAVPLAFAACGGDDSSSDGIVNSLSVLADGATFTPDIVSATVTSGVLNIQAQGTSGGVARTLSVAVKASAAGTFTVGAVGGASVTYTELAAGASTPKQWKAADGAGSGTFTLSQFTSAVAVGTFSGTLPPVTASGATAAKAISGGTFTLKVTYPY